MARSVKCIHQSITPRVQILSTRGKMQVWASWQYLQSQAFPTQRWRARMKTGRSLKLIGWPAWPNPSGSGSVKDFVSQLHFVSLLGYPDKNNLKEKVNYLTRNFVTVCHFRGSQGLGSQAYSQPRAERINACMLVLSLLSPSWLLTHRNLSASAS